MKKTNDYGWSAVSTLRGWGMFILVIDLIAAAIFALVAVKSESPGQGFMLGIALVVGGVLSFGILAALATMAEGICSLRKDMERLAFDLPRTAIAAPATAVASSTVVPSKTVIVECPNCHAKEEVEATRLKEDAAYKRFNAKYSPLFGNIKFDCVGCQKRFTKEVFVNAKGTWLQ